MRTIERKCKVFGNEKTGEGQAGFLAKLTPPVSADDKRFSYVGIEFTGTEGTIKVWQAAREAADKALLAKLAGIKLEGAVLTGKDIVAGAEAILAASRDPGILNAHIQNAVWRGKCGIPMPPITVAVAGAPSQDVGF